MSSAQVICMASVKGGSGKTVLAATFGAVLSEMGKQVVLIDTDAATNGLSLLYLNEVIERREELRLNGLTGGSGTYELAGGGDRRPEFVELGAGLRLLPATYEFFDSEKVGLEAYMASLRRVVTELRPSCDFILLDAQAGSDGFAHGAMRRDVSDKVVLVSEYDPLSAAGVERLKALFAEDLAYDRVWVLLNKMLPDIATRYGEFLEVARYLPPVPWDADVVRAYSRRTLALDLEGGNSYTVAVCRTLAAMLDAATATELNDWLSQKASELRTPLLVQIRDLKAEMEAVSEREVKLINRQETVSLITTGFAAIAVAVAFVAGFSGPGRVFGVVGLTIGAIAVIAMLMLMRVRDHARGQETSRLSKYERTIHDRLASLELLARLSDDELVGNGPIRLNDPVEEIQVESGSRASARDAS